MECLAELRLAQQTVDDDPVSHSAVTDGNPFGLDIFQDSHRHGRAANDNVRAVGVQTRNRSPLFQWHAAEHFYGISQVAGFDHVVPECRRVVSQPPGCDMRKVSDSTRATIDHVDPLIHRQAGTVPGDCPDVCFHCAVFLDGHWPFCVREEAVRHADGAQLQAVQGEILVRIPYYQLCAASADVDE